MAITSAGDIIGNFAASIPDNKCAYLVHINIVTGLACLALSIMSFV